MTIYAIGDIQGCAQSFDNLLEKISFDHTNDFLWLAGDFVNRGPDSLGVLRRLIKMEDNVTAVLGNHDLHLLAIFAGVRQPNTDDTFEEVLKASDSESIIHWLRHRPLLHYDKKNDRALVHAGIPPCWSLEQAKDHANDLTTMLTSVSWKNNLKEMYGNNPATWGPSLTKQERRRFSINAFTRIRYCYSDGTLDFTHKGPPRTHQKIVKPWYEFVRPENYKTHIYFGHWASLGLARFQNCTCLDSGCVWGRQLTAVPIDPPGNPITVLCDEDALT